MNILGRYDMSASEAVKKVRVNCYLTVDEFSKEIGISRHTVYNYERGLRKPKLDTIKKIRELAKKNGLDIPIEDFLK